MEELNEMDMSEGAWMNKFKTLRHDYLHHIEEEEDEVFTRAKEVISDSEIDGYGDRSLLAPPGAELGGRWPYPSGNPCRELRSQKPGASRSSCPMRTPTR